MIDIVGPLPDSYGYKYLLTSICRSTRYLQATPMTEATSSAAASAFLHHWVSIFGVPSQVTSDNGASFLANLWKDMMTRLNIKVQYSASYRPQSIGLLERQHRSIKDSLKAAIVEMGEKYQNKWLDYLPFVLLGRRVAHQPDIGASSSEMCFGTNVRIPGQLLMDPGEIEDEETLQSLLQDVRQKTLRPISQPSRHNKQEPLLPGIPADAKFAYTKQHQTTGLQPPYEGPFKIAEKLSRSTVKLEVGIFKDGRKRYEIRHANDLKFAHPKSLAAPILRPQVGRPSNVGTSDLGETPNTTDVIQNQFPEPPVENKQPVEVDGKSRSSSHATSNRAVHEPPSENQPGKIQTSNRLPARSTRNPNPLYVDAIQTRPARAWSASDKDLEEINRSIQLSRPRHG